MKKPGTIPPEPKDLRIPRLKSPLKNSGHSCGTCRYFMPQPFGATCLLLGYGRAFANDPAFCGEYDQK